MNQFMTETHRRQKPGKHQRDHILVFRLVAMFKVLFCVLSVSLANGLPAIQMNTSEVVTNHSPTKLHGAADPPLEIDMQYIEDPANFTAVPETFSFLTGASFGKTKRIEISQTPLTKYAKQRSIIITNYSDSFPIRLRVTGQSEADLVSTSISEQLLSKNSQVTILPEFGSTYRIQVFFKVSDYLVATGPVGNEKINENRFPDDQPKYTWTYQPQAWMVSSYSGPALFPLWVPQSDEKKSLGYGNGITIGYSDGSFAVNLFYPKFLILHNVYINTGEAVDASTFLNFGVGVTWLEALSAGVIFDLSSTKYSGTFIGIDVTKIFGILL